MILPDLYKLFEPFTAGGATLDGSRQWLLTKAKSAGIPEAIADQAIAETMLEVAAGVDFTLPCECGCGVVNAHRHIEHHMLAKMIALHSAAEESSAALLQSSLHGKILEHIGRENEEFEAEHMRPGIWKRFWVWFNDGQVVEPEEPVEGVDEADGDNQ